MDNLAIHFLNDDEQPVTQEAVEELVSRLRSNQLANAWLALVFKEVICMDNLAIHFLNDDEQPVTQEAVEELVSRLRSNQLANAWLALDEYGEEDFLSVDIASSWAALAFNTWDENGEAHQYLPINPRYAPWI